MLLNSYLNSLLLELAIVALALIIIKDKPKPQSTKPPSSKMVEETQQIYTVGTNQGSTATTAQVGSPETKYA